MFWYWFLYENLTLPKAKVVESTLTQVWLNLKQHIIGLNHNNHQVGFEIVMQIIHVLCWRQTLERKQIAENRLLEILK